MTATGCKVEEVEEVVEVGLFLVKKEMKEQAKEREKELEKPNEQQEMQRKVEKVEI